MIAAFTLSSLVVIGLAALYFYRNRHKSESLGHCPSREPPAAPDNVRSLSAKEATKTATLLDSITKPDEIKARRPINTKSLLAVMDEKLEKPKSSSHSEQKIFFKNEIDDNRSDKSNVPLAILYKK